jgi:mono/diheme cytochrome c family protein
MPISNAALALLFFVQQPAQNPPPSPAQPAPAPQPPDVHAEHPARPVFLANCAQCHGETGDGKGTTKLDRDPRNFQAGGFSYGNTPEAIARTIAYGIPGSPMPSFEKALKPEQRKLLAEYVLLLGPPQEKTDPKDSVMLVKDKPLIVRGKLPPLVEGGQAFPRGVLIGTPEGLTFEYRVDDVRLLAVLKGEFVDRADWRGRGGDPLTPLGKAVWTDLISPEHAMFALEVPAGMHEQELAQRIRSTSVGAKLATLTYDLLSEQNVLASVEESPSALVCELGTGFVRHFRVRAIGGPFVLRVRMWERHGERLESGASGNLTWSLPPTGLELHHVLLIRKQAAKSVDGEGNAGSFFFSRLQFEKGEAREFDFVVLPAVKLVSEKAIDLLGPFQRVLSQ